MLFGFFLRVSSPDPPQPYRASLPPPLRPSGPPACPRGFSNPLWASGDLGEDSLEKTRITYIYSRSRREYESEGIFKFPEGVARGKFEKSRGFIFLTGKGSAYSRKKYLINCFFTSSKIFTNLTFIAYGDVQDWEGT